MLVRPFASFRAATLSAALVGLALPLGLVGCTGNTVCDDCGDGGSGGSANTTGEGGNGAGTGTGSGTGTGTEVAGEWTKLMTADWQLGAGDENTSDLHFLTVDHDTYVGAIRPIAPVGTHHTVLAINNVGAGNIIYASGVGTNALVFPKGVGLKILAGQTLVLQLHIFNASAQPIVGTSGIEIIEIAAADVENEADLFLPGPFNLNIPPNQKVTQSGTCTVKAKQQYFAIFPHMHQLGSHFTTTLTINGKPNVIHDGDYEFDHQAFIPFEPITVNPGDTIKTDCTWNNTTPESIGWGESSNSEMCFSILYRYPAQGGDGLCGQ